MLFLHPMWDNLSERVGKQKCTPVGYALHGAAEYVGFVGLLSLVCTIAVFLWRWYAGTFAASLWWLLVPTFGLGLFSEAMMQLSWWMAYRKNFRYDCDRREASWLEAGERRVYKCMGRRESR